MRFLLNSAEGSKDLGPNMDISMPGYVIRTPPEHRVLTMRTSQKQPLTFGNPTIKRALGNWVQIGVLGYNDYYIGSIGVI